MNSSQKKHLVYYLNIGLLVVNIAALVFIFSGKFTSGLSKVPIDMNDKVISNQFLKEELKLSDGQYAELCRMDSMVQVRYEKVLKFLCCYRYQLVNELAMPEPSIEELSRLSKSIGQMHTALKRQTSYHIMNIKKICTPEQEVKLKELLKEMMELEKHCHKCTHKCSQKEKCLKASNINQYMKDSLRVSYEELGITN